MERAAIGASRPLHIHLGGGSLGLGLIGESIMSKRGQQLVIFNRDSARLHHRVLATKKSYHIRDGNQTNGLISGFDYVAGFTEDQFADACSKSEYVIVTTAVGESNLPDVARLLAAAIKKRARSSKRGLLAILPCENMRNAGIHLSKEILTRMSEQQDVAGPQQSPLENVAILDTIADRICIRVENTDEAVFVDAEPSQYATWYISDPQKAGAEIFLPHIKGLKFVKILSEVDMDIMWHRKLWCFNGLHLAAAARAHQAGIGQLHLLFAGEHRLRLRRLSHELSLALHLYSIKTHQRDTRDENLRFCRLALERMAANKEDVADRILRNLLDVEKIPGKQSIAPADQLSSAARSMEVFLGKLQDRLGAPAQHLFLNAKALSRLRSAELQTGLHILLCINAMHAVFKSVNET